MKTLPLLTIVLTGLLPLQLGAESTRQAPGKLFIAGGGSLSDALREHFISLSSVPDPKLLIIPHAAREEKLTSSGTSNAETFRRLGVSDVTVLDLNDADQAANLIQRSDLIWMPGGIQRRLMSALDEAEIADTVRARVADGVPIGGTSAGAAIMSEVMIASSRRDLETGALIPIFSHGLGLWPEAIVDQHFSQRNRLSRLESAVKDHPNHVGIGIDEGTAVVFDGDRARVMGAGTVTVVRASTADSSKPLLEHLVLRAGETLVTPRSAVSENLPIE